MRAVHVVWTDAEVPVIPCARFVCVVCRVACVREKTREKRKEKRKDGG